MKGNMALLMKQVLFLSVNVVTATVVGTANPVTVVDELAEAALLSMAPDDQCEQKSKDS